MLLISILFAISKTSLIFLYWMEPLTSFDNSIKQSILKSIHAIHDKIVFGLLKQNFCNLIIVTEFKDNFLSLSNFNLLKYIKFVPFY